jgi:hypothetical protein
VAAGNLARAPTRGPRLPAAYAKARPYRRAPVSIRERHTAAVNLRGNGLSRDVVIQLTTTERQKLEQKETKAVKKERQNGKGRRTILAPDLQRACCTLTRNAQRVRVPLEAGLLLHIRSQCAARVLHNGDAGQG